MVNPLRWRGHEVSRLEAFSDTVFAFALTLLVVALEVPHDYQKLVDLMKGFPAFACCFALLVWIWSEHNTFFRRFGMQDGYTVALNADAPVRRPAVRLSAEIHVRPPVCRVCWDGAKPAPDAAYPARKCVAIYALGFMAVFIVFALLYHHAYRCRAALELSELEVFDARSGMAHHLVSTGVGLISLLIATVAPLQLTPHRYRPPSPFCGRSTGLWGVQSRKRRDALVARLAPTARRRPPPDGRIPHLPDYAQRGSHPAMVDPPGPRVVAARDDRRSRRPHRRLDPHHPPRSRGAPGGRLSALRRSPRRQEILDARAARLPPSRRHRLHARGDDARSTSRASLVECLAATPFQRDVRSAFDKLAGALTPGCASSSTGCRS